MGMEFVYITFIIAIIIGVGVGLLQTPMGKGWLGELLVKIIIGKTKEGEKYVINDLRLKINDTKTSQIDHVLINNKGIFVIETKNYSGRIYGKESQGEWTQVLNYGRVKNRFYNPVKQNKTHAYYVSNVISEEIPLVSAVVFIQNNTQYIDSTGVFNLFGLYKLIRNGNTVFNAEQMKNAFDDLNNVNDRSITLGEHIENIENMLNDIENGICPRCGSNLVLRHGKNGDFWGCSNYPNCRFTKRK